MTTTRASYRARTRYIITDLAGDALIRRSSSGMKPFVLIDAGARDAFSDPRWKAIGPDRAVIHGFEADEEECIRLNAEAAERGLGFRYHPQALWSHVGKAVLYLLRNRSASSLFPPRPATAHRWRYHYDDFMRDSMTVDTECVVDTTTLDHLRRNGEIPSFDFLKMNVQGGELEILRGAEASLDSVVGMQIELSFVGTYEGAPLFSDIDAYLRERGFVFFDSLAPNFVRRAASPLRLGQDYSIAWRWPTGQMFEGHFLYLKDPLMPGAAPMSAEATLKLAAFAEMWGQVEFAFELLVHLAEREEEEGRHEDARETRRIMDQAIATYSEVFPEILCHPPTSAQHAAFVPDRRFERDIRESDKVMLARIERFAATRGEGTAPLRILDVGCGTGNLLAHLGRTALPLVLEGIDYHKEAIAYAQDRSDLAGARLRVGDMRDPFGEARYDVVVINNVLHQSGNDEFGIVVANAAAALVPGGLLVMFDLFNETDQFLDIVERRPDGNVSAFFCIRPSRWVEAALAGLGLHEVAVEPFEPPDLPQPASERDLTTFTRTTAAGRIAFRGGLYQPWVHLSARKA